MRKLWHKMINAWYDFEDSAIWLALPILELGAKIIRLPMRVVCWRKKHIWIFQGGGFFMTPKYPLYCKRCLKETSWDDESVVSR